MKSGIFAASFAVVRLFSLVSILIATVPQSAFACSTDAGLDRVLLPGRLVLFGEIHGTAEAPAVFSSAVCRALEQGLELSVGLEFNRDQVDPLHVYLESGGDKEAVERLLRSPFWSRSMQDGRSSAAMLDMVERLRQLKHQHPKLSVFVLYEQIDSAAVGTTPDEIMAHRVRVERERRPQALLLVLVGNYHSRLRTERTENLLKPNGRNSPESMGALLTELSPLSILLEGSGGNAWICTPDCAAHSLPVPQDLHAGPKTAYQILERDALYSAMMSIGTTTASPPAIQTLLKH
jgi:hypothetical protein